MMLNCKKCGAPYTGGVICEKCGNRFDDADIRNFENEVRQQREYEQFRAERNKESENKAIKVILIVLGIFMGLAVLGVLVAIFVPAFIGYNAKKKAHEEQQRAREEQANSAYYEDYDYSYEDDAYSYDE